MSLFPAWDNHKYMLMLDAYFDETGHGQDPNTRLLGIAGCLGRSDTWQAVETKWRDVLKAESLPYFHMNEYAQSRGIFEGWKKDEKRRQKVYGELWNIILDAPIAPIMPIGAFVVLDEYNETLKDKDHNPITDAYFLCYLQCLRFLAQYVDFDLLSNVSTFFDDKKGFRGEAFRIYDILKHHFRGKIPQPIFRNMRDFAPLQVADIIAYESKKEFERELYRPDADCRWGFRQLDELIKRAQGKYPICFGDGSCPIALLSNDELNKIADAQKAIDDED